jgi:hypothetical protein
MTHTALMRGNFEELRRHVEKFRAGDPWELFVQALDGFLTAAEYEDETLMRSHIEVEKVSVSERLASIIDERVKNSSWVLDKLRGDIDRFESEPFEPNEEVDATGRAFEDLAREEHSRLAGLRDGPLAMLRKHGVEVPNAAKLDAEIARWQSFHKDTIDCWPWINGPLPPVDRELVERSRSARGRGEAGEEIEALITRLQSE